MAYGVSHLFFDPFSSVLMVYRLSQGASGNRGGFGGRGGGGRGGGAGRGAPRGGGWGGGRGASLIIILFRLLWILLVT